MDDKNQFNWEETIEKTENDKYIEQLKSDYKECFRSEIGKRVLEHLSKKLELPVADPNVNSNFAYYREGENQIIRMILNLASGKE